MQPFKIVKRFIFTKYVMKLFLFPDKECELLALHSDDMRTKIDELRREHADDFFLGGLRQLERNRSLPVPKYLFGTG